MGTGQTHGTCDLYVDGVKYGSVVSYSIEPSVEEPAPIRWVNEPYVVVADCSLSRDDAGFFSRVFGRPFRMVRDADGKWQPKARPRSGFSKGERRRERGSHRRAIQRAKRLWPQPRLAVRYENGSYWWVLLGADCPPVRCYGQTHIKWIAR